MTLALVPMLKGGTSRKQANKPCDIKIMILQTMSQKYIHSNTYNYIQSFLAV